jgi:serine/threonine-protein kinase
MPECPQCSTNCISEAAFCHLCGTSLDLSDFQPIVSSDPLVGRVIADRYRLKALIGRGGMGVVYRGEHVHMGKTVAIKLLHGELAANKDLVKRFKREAEAISKLSNIHTVTIFDYGRSQGLIFLVMEYLQGRDMGWHVRKEGKMPLLRACMVLVQACDSLIEAHSHGIVHRDLKPENVFLLDREDMKDFVKVLDFGLAKVRPEIKRPDDTAHGAVLGTPYYMPPEQIRGDIVDHRVDLYAMGGLLHCLLTGHPPYRAPTALAVMAAHLTEPLPTLDDEELDAEVREAVLPVMHRCLAKKADERYASATDLKGDLLSIIERFYTTGHTPVTGLPEGFSKAALDEAESTAIREPAKPKEEVERYARRLKIRRVFLWALPVLFVLALGTGAFVLLRGADRGPPPGDVEPNNKPSEASPIAPSVPVAGTIGKRISKSESDHDWYVFEIVEHALVRVHLKRLPEVDLMLQIFREGSEKPYATSSSGGRGIDEALSGLSLDPGRYFILVRQDLSKRGRPVEVISDSYWLSLQILDPGLWEIEPNDTVTDATKLEKGAARKGYVQQSGDRDFYCLDAPGSEVSATLEPPGKIAMRLFTVDLATGAWSPHDAKKKGGTITVEGLSSGKDEGICFQVASRDGAHDVRTPYTLTVK